MSRLFFTHFAQTTRLCYITPNRKNRTRFPLCLAAIGKTGLLPWAWANVHLPPTAYNSPNALSSGLNTKK